MGGMADGVPTWMDDAVRPGESAASWLATGATCETIGAKLAAEFAPLTVVGQRMCPSTVRIRISRVAESFFGRTAGQESQTYKK